MNLLICAIKSWNLDMARSFSKASADRVEIISEKEKLTLEFLEKYQPDFIFFPHWSWILPKEIYETYPCVVFHMTDLPYGRGGSPLQNLIARGWRSTKISALRVTGELDAGPVYLKEPLELYGTAEEILIRASEIIFHKMIPAILTHQMAPSPQQGEPVLFERRRPEDGEISGDMSLEKIYDTIRMLDAEGYPNAFLQMGRYRIEFRRAFLGYKKLRCEIMMTEAENEQSVGGCRTSG